MTKEKPVTSSQDEKHEEHFARLAILDHIMGEYSPRKCLSDKELKASLMKLFKFDQEELTTLACALEFYRASLAAERKADLTLAEELRKKWI